MSDRDAVNFMTRRQRDGLDGGLKRSDSMKVRVTDSGGRVVEEMERR